MTRPELLAAGVTSNEIQHRLRIGALIPEYDGVYRVGHRARSLEARYLAAVLACGDEARLCGKAAAYLYGLIKGSAPPPEVGAPTKRRRRGVKTHRWAKIDPRDVTVWRGIPITTVPRTLVDMAAAMSEDDLGRACHEAGVRFETTPRLVEAVLTRRPSSPGAVKLRRILHGDADIVLSKLEERFLEIMRGAGLPRPKTNRRKDRKYVDCRWAEHGLTVELDSYRYHRSRHAWEEDHRRERRARQRGDEFRRYTWADVFEDPSFMVRDLRGLLRRQRPSSSP